MTSTTQPGSCRACGSPTTEVLNMGQLPLAGNYADGPTAKRYPLELDSCTVCGLLQVRQTVPHDVIFGPTYAYASSTVPALVQHFNVLAAGIAQLVPMGRVLEIGCNDGVLLKALKPHGITAIGVDASDNVAELARQASCDARTGVFNSQAAGQFGEPFDLVTCSNVFAHNEDPNDFLQGVRQVLKPDGRLIIEVHNAALLFQDNQWDCFYHEHVFYWDEAPLCHILARNNFIIERIDYTRMHGGGLRIQARKASAAPYEKLDKLPWHEFAPRVKRSAEILRTIVQALQGYHVMLFGAAGRAATLVNYAEIGNRVAYAFDGSPLRIGQRLAGTNVKIYDEAELAGSAEGYFLLGAWHLADQLVPKIQTACPRNYGIIQPLPSCTIR